MNYLSLFSGLDAATLAWAPLGWRCAGVADGPRYKMLGNSFAVPVIRWIGQSLEDACNAS